MVVETSEDTQQATAIRPVESGVGDENISRSELLRKLKCDAEAGPGQLDMVSQCCDYYAKQGVIVDDIARPLHEKCRVADECWAPFRHCLPVSDRALLSVPWVGPQYDHGICTVGINLNSYGGLGALWWFTRGAIEDLHQNHRRGRGFHFRVGQYMAAILTACDSQHVPDAGALDAPMAACAWSRCAFTEAVKCSPVAGVSKPGDAMWRNCPGRYLAEELRILAPRIIVAVGQPTWSAITNVFDVKGTDYAPRGFWRGQAKLDNQATIEIFFVNHSSWGHWRTSLPALISSLRARPPRAKQAA